MFHITIFEKFMFKVDILTLSITTLLLWMGKNINSYISPKMHYSDAIYLVEECWLVSLRLRRSEPEPSDR